jgi:hypothetical protein
MENMKGLAKGQEGIAHIIVARKVALFWHSILWYSFPYSFCCHPILLVTLRFYPQVYTNRLWVFCSLTS